MNLSAKNKVMEENNLLPLSELLQQKDFIRRHLGVDMNQINAMLQKLGVNDLEELITETVPQNILQKKPLALGDAMGEHKALEYLQTIMSENKLAKSMLGMGYYNCYTPAVIQRCVLENPGWYTAYTPYQAEISQGRLELLLNFQQMVVDLTGMDCANASLLDEATAAAESMTLARRVSRNKSLKFFADINCFPQTLDVLTTRAKQLNNIELICGKIDAYVEKPEDYFGVLIQYPSSNGEIKDFSKLINLAHKNNALACVATDLLALVLLKSPGSLGADIVFGSSQRFGVPMGFGGPHAAFFAVKEQYQRNIPGRLIGVSIDSKGKQVLRMALQTREQHIRRDKATSNICTAQVLLANIASLFASYHGYEGLLTIAIRVHRLAYICAEGLKRQGYQIVTTDFFDTIAIKTDMAGDIQKRAELEGYNLRRIDENLLSISFDETIEITDVQNILNIFAKQPPKELDKGNISVNDIEQQLSQAYSFDLDYLRTDEILSHSVFNDYQTETKMMRYLRRLQHKDIGLDKSMIALGSCTMKLNAASEMMPISWDTVNSLHPFAPSNQTKGYTVFLKELEDMLKAITGFAAISFQPNSGAQGEYAGLLAIHFYHLSRNDSQRDICLIPSSAHGTNPASAIMAGMNVKVVGCDDKGNVDITDLKKKISENAGGIAALMITYPSTHGVFEDAIKDICDVIHQEGGQVYMDGANLNAMVGIAQPHDIGADVCHINLHKTFCIPHGGGGPGMGPIGVAEHLVKFLPGHNTLGNSNNTVSAAPYGSASILPISWAYIKMMGADGLTLATKIAILNANYIAERLKGHYPILYKGTKGRNAHECIFDLRDIKKSSGISEEDIAKRLIDYGFHAPTMSFPVAGTLMVEPTESESKEEIDRFCDAMISIRSEISMVENKELPLEDNPLVNAPHTLEDLYGDWEHSYSKQQAFYPLPYLQTDKYFAPVNRINNPHGDRNLMCICPPIEEYQ